jgi:FG-GAP-like repeat/RTX calcium-binding nonapeptide repeat (4 copies)/Putative Ig domain
MPVFRSSRSDRVRKSAQLAAACESVQWARLESLEKRMLLSGSFAASTSTLSVGNAPTSVASADLNGDGIPDLVVANYRDNTVQVFLGNGDGTFQSPETYSVPNGPSSVIVADVGNGSPDILVASQSSNTASVLLGNGSGHFQAAIINNVAAGVTIGPDALAVATLPGYGSQPDLVVADGFSGSVSILIGNGNGTFGSPKTLSTSADEQPDIFGVAVGDIQGDGRPSIVAVDYENNYLDVFRSNGSHFYSPNTYFVGGAPTSLALGDLTGDGQIDAVVTEPHQGATGDVGVLLNNGSGLGPVSNLPTTNRPFQVIIADLGNDHRPDIVTVNASAAGITYHTVNVFPANGDGTFGAAATYNVGNGPRSITAADFNGDGRLDLAVGNLVDNTVTILTSGHTSDLTFTVPSNISVGQSPYYVAAGDLNGDGIPDLVVAENSTVKVLLGNGDGGFTAGGTYSVGGDTGSVVVANLGNGFPDIIVSNLQSNTVSVFLGNGTGHFPSTPIVKAIPEGISRGQAVAVGDLNGDGIPDLVVADGDTGDVSVFMGNGDGDFGAGHMYSLHNLGCGPAYASAVAIGDFSGDGHPDIVATDSRYNFADVLVNNGSGGFSTQLHYSVGTKPKAVAVGDLTGDGTLDIVTADYGSSTVSVLLNNGGGTFKSALTYSAGNGPSAVAIADVNGDGRADIVTLDNGRTSNPMEDFTLPSPETSIPAGPSPYYAHEVAVLLGNGDGSFASPKFLVVGNKPVSLAVADFNGDAKPDIAALNSYDGNISILLNQTPVSPTITSSNSFTFTTGISASFAVTTSGYPTSSLTEAGTLPSGVSFVDNGNGTATMFGTPASGIGGTYSVTITASNGVSPDGTQTLTVTVDQPPVITSTSSFTFTTGTVGSFTITTTGFPNAMLSEIGSLPGGISFVDNGDGTATIFGTPASGTGGNYTLTLSAINGTSPNGTQSFTLTVDQPPAFIGGSGFTFTVGTAGSCMILSSGFPTAAITESGALPGGVSFVDNGNGSATLSGTPAAGTSGAYTLTLTASNTAGSAQETFAVSVDGPPALISANNTAFVTASTGTFTFTASGLPTPAFTETGTLPTGVSFVDNGNSTATLSGTPAAGTAGTYSLTVTASSSFSTAQQVFTLTVEPPPTVTMNNGTVTLMGTNTNDVVGVSISGDNVMITVDAQQHQYSINTISLVTINEGAGNDSVMIGAGVPAVNVNGGSGNDTIMGNNTAPDTLMGGDGNDSIMGMGNDDSLDGGNGNDMLMSGGSNSTLRGSIGNDTVMTSTSDDHLHGGAGDDFFFDFGSGGNHIHGGLGLNFSQYNPTDTMADIFQVIDPPAPPTSPSLAALDQKTLIAAVQELASAQDQVSVNAGILTVDGTSNADSISATSDGTNLTLTVNGAAQQFPLSELSGIAIAGLGGSDTISVDASVSLPTTLKGGGGNDSISGGGGDNVLVGGAGSDTLVGGGGTNLLVADQLQTYADAALGQDSLVGGSGFNIADFAYRTDNLTLSNNGQLTGGEIIASSVQAIWGGTGADSITGTTPGNFLSGGVGPDTLQGGTSADANDLLVGGKGKDSIVVAAEPVTVYVEDGVDGNDTVTGVTNQSEDIIESDPGDSIGP